MNNDFQLAKAIYHRILAMMKFALDLEEQRYPERGRNDDRYKFFKKQLMAFTYDNLRDLFDELAENELIVQTEYAEDVQNGYKQTQSGGSGFLNSEKLTELLNAE